MKVTQELIAQYTAGLKVEVKFYRKEEFLAEPGGENSLAFINAMGGFISTVYSDAAKARIVASPYFTDKIKAEVLSVPKTGVVAVLVDVIEKEVMTVDEVRALLLHEEGHLILGHLKNISMSDEEIMALSEEELFKATPSVLLSVEREMEADAYAAERTSKQALKSAIDKCVMRFVRNTVANTSATVEEVEAFVEVNCDHAKRMAALS